MRISKEQYFLEMAILVSKRGTCIRRNVGCVLVDKDDYVISTGYNGVPKGETHCTEGSSSCNGWAYPTGIGLEDCQAIHAEVNAVAHCENPKRIHKAFITVSPCVHCMKLLLATPCKEIVTLEIYDAQAALNWESQGRIINVLKF